MRILRRPAQARGLGRSTRARDLARDGCRRRAARALCESLEGFWIGFYPSLHTPHAFRAHAIYNHWNGRALEMELRDSLLHLKGSVRPANKHVFVTLEHVGSGDQTFAVFRQPFRQPAAITDGLFIGVSQDATMTTAAGATVHIRIGDLTGDPDEDRARYDRLRAAIDAASAAGRIPPLMPDELKQWLRCTVGPTAADAGDGRILRIPAAQSWSEQEALLRFAPEGSPKRRAVAAFRNAFAPALAASTGNVTKLVPKSRRRAAGA